MKPTYQQLLRENAELRERVNFMQNLIQTLHTEVKAATISTPKFSEMIQRQREPTPLYIVR